MTPNLNLEPVLFDIASGKNGFDTPVPRPLLKILKVQGVNMRDPYQPSDEKFAYRMFVNDGKLTMYACLSPRMHFYIDLQVLTKGAYIRPLVYEVRTELKKASDRKFTRFLVIHDLSVEYSPSFLFNDELNQIDEEEKEAVREEKKAKLGDEAETPAATNSNASQSSDHQNPSSVTRSASFQSSASPTPPTSAQPFTQVNEEQSLADEETTPAQGQSLKHRLDDEAEGEVAVDNPEPKSILLKGETPSSATIMPPPPPPSSQFTSLEGRQLRARTTARRSMPSQASALLRSQVRHTSFRLPSQQQQQHLPPPGPVSPDTLPEITPLGQLISAPIGRRVNILAIVTWVSAQIITRNIGNKRDMDVLDQTSQRPTRLSVWLDLDRFIPKAGDVVLFRGLYVHKYDGRSLNAFQELEGTNWFELEPNVPQNEELRSWYLARIKESS